MKTVVEIEYIEHNRHWRIPPKEYTMEEIQWKLWGLIANADVSNIRIIKYEKEV